MDLQKLIDTMAEIIGEKHNIKVTAKIQDKGDFLHYEGVVRNERDDKNKKNSGIYTSIHTGAGQQWSQLKNAERRDRQVG